MGEEKLADVVRSSTKGKGGAVESDDAVRTENICGRCADYADTDGMQGWMRPRHARYYEY